MLESDFLISINNMVVTDNYDSNHFNSVFEMLKKYCEADAVITDDFRKNENMISYKNIALSRENLLSHIWGYDFYGDDRTVDTHVKTLRKHLGKYKDMIVTVRAIGYKFVYED